MWHVWALPPLPLLDLATMIAVSRLEIRCPKPRLLRAPRSLFKFLVIIDVEV